MSSIESIFCPHGTTNDKPYMDFIPIDNGEYQCISCGKIVSQDEYDTQLFLKRVVYQQLIKGIK